MLVSLANCHGPSGQPTLQDPVKADLVGVVVRVRRPLLNIKNQLFRGVFSELTEKRPKRVSGKALMGLGRKVAIWLA